MDPALIARRRHTVRMFLRLAVLALAVWASVPLLRALTGAAYSMAFGGLRVTDMGPTVVLGLIEGVNSLAIAATLFFCEARLVRWLVPAAPRLGRCPACDYDVRYATGGRCPECGLALPPPRPEGR
jgi:hypothetical protein